MQGNLLYLFFHRSGYPRNIFTLTIKHIFIALPPDKLLKADTL